MTSDDRARVDRLCNALRDRLGKPPLVFSSSSSALREAPEYRELLARGVDAIEPSIDRARRDFPELVWVVLDIARPRRPSPLTTKSTAEHNFVWFEARSSRRS